MGAVSFSLVCSLLLLLLIQSGSSGCRCGAQSRVCWHVGWRLLWRHLDNKFVFNLALVHLNRIIHDALLPLIFEVEKDVFASYISAASWIGLKRNLLVMLKFQMHYGRLCKDTYFGVCFAEPGLEFLVELPVFLFKLDGCQVLLVATLLVVEHKKKGLQVEPLEVLFPSEQRHVGESMLVPD